MWTRSLADADASCGGKARGLARLIAAGLRVPDGFVIEGAAFGIAAGLDELATTALDELGHALGAAAARVMSATLPDALIAEVEHRARALGGALAVRSSATIEDGEAGAAAGVFSSRTAVRFDELWPAIRAVWASALTPLAASYARRRGAVIAIAVIVQRFVPGERAILYTRPPGDPARDEAWLQRRGALTRLPRAAVALASRIEAAIEAPAGADVELVEEGEDAWIVQARPIVHPEPARPRQPPPPSVLAPLRDGRRWTWDVTHNPDPMSTAQAELVERVDAAGAAPWSLRVCAGYLYAAPRDDVAPPAIELADVVEQIARIEVELARVLDAGSDALDDALARYEAFYAIWARELSPRVAALRDTRGEGHRPSAVEAVLLAAARGELDEPAVLDRLGVLAPAWDVAAPTFAEQPALIRDAIARARAAGGRAAPARPLDVAAELAERDDLWFARAQWLVRRAILARARSLHVAPDDACWVPLADLMPGDAPPPDPQDLARKAAGRKAAAARAARWAMPVVIGGEPVPAGVPLRGIGSGPQVSGRVVRFASLAAAIAVRSGDVVVTRAITPALAVFVVGCAAIVSETGGPLDHGAAMARELGIPFVVGCTDAWSLLADGMLVTVDGDAGVVTR